jgi:hypothetical protein
MVDDMDKHLKDQYEQEPKDFYIEASEQASDRQNSD